MRERWRRFLAYWRFDLALVCELSHGRAPHDDYHDYPDSTAEHPWHFFPHTCKRCGKDFVI